jgi:hypothetical protein
MPNTITSPEQQSMLRIMKEAGPEPPDPMILAAMVGSTNLASKGFVEREAKKQTEAVSKAKVSFEALPDGTVVVNSKNVPVQDPRTAIAQAGDKPYQKLFKQLKDYGLNVEDPDAPAVEKGSFGEGYRASRELGGSVFSALLDGARVRTGRLSKEDAQAQVKDARVQRLLAIKKAYPEIENAEADENTAVKAEQQKRDKIRAVINDLSYEALTPENVRAGAGLPGTQGLPDWAMNELAAKRKAFEEKLLSDNEKEVSRRIKGMKRSVVADYDSFDEWVADNEDVDFDEETAARARRQFDALKTEAIRAQLKEEKKEARAEARDARAEAAAGRAETRAERVERKQEATEKRQELKDREAEINRLGKAIDDNNKEIVRNQRDFAKTLNKEERTVLQATNRGLVAQNKKLMEQLTALRGKGGAKIEYATPAEWDALIASGETPESLKSQGIAKR